MATRRIRSIQASDYQSPATMKIHSFMMPISYTVTRDIPILEVYELMDQHRLKYIPVEYAGEAVGVISITDIKVALSTPETKYLTAQQVMQRDPYAVRPQTPLSEVIAHMAKSDHNYALVLRNKKAAGIFTTREALQLLGQMLPMRAERAA